MNLPFLPSEFSAEGSPVQVVNIHPVLCWQDSRISGMFHVLLLRSFCTRSWTDLPPVMYLCIYNALGHLKVVLEQSVLHVGGGKKRESIE